MVDTKTKLSELEKERKRRSPAEMLRLAGCLDNIDDDVADMCIAIMPKNDNKLISLSDLMEGVQKIKDKLSAKATSTPRGENEDRGNI